MAAEGLADSKRLKGPKRPWKDEELQMDAKDLGWSKRLKGMRDLKEDMYNSDIWFGMLGLGDKKKYEDKEETAD